MSIRRAILNVCLKIFEQTHLKRTKEPRHIRSSFERKARILFHPPRGSKFEARDLGGIPCVHACAPGIDAKMVVLYFHGGGYVFGSPRTHQAMMARLSALTGCEVWLPDYRLAPETPFPGAVEDALSAYRALVEKVGARNIILGGDSAGGGLALALLGQICTLNLEQPAGTFGFSALTDVTLSGASIRENARSEVVLPPSRMPEIQAMYLQGADAKDPRVSPLFGDYHGVGPVFLTASDSEILYDDTRRMAARLAEQGVDITEDIQHNLPHVWQIFQTILPEADQSLATLAEWIRSLSSQKFDS